MELIDHKFNNIFVWGSACCGVHILLSMYSLCGVLPPRRTHRFAHCIPIVIIFICAYYSKMKLLVFMAEKLWSGLENFVFDWLINADR